MNLEEETGINIGDFATGIVFLHNLHEKTQKEFEESNREFFPEKHEGPVVDIYDYNDFIEVIIEVEEFSDYNTHKTATRYRYEFQNIYEVECICGNKKLYHSNKEKWICPFC